MPTTADLLALTRSPEGKKWIRYSLISVICAIISTVTFTLLVGPLGWHAFWASVTATGVATLPSYELNRKWAWGKRGKSHLWKEVVPFWVLALIGLAFATLCSVTAESYSHSHKLSHPVQTLVLGVAFVGSYGVLWVGKFIIINKLLFVHHPQDLSPALDGRSGLPG